ncbi:MAG: xanthine dehydrogenase [Bacteroidetes bacterium 4572_117]|nr:MAG: xanthine dehydrogenase [Bacteroidetes bacterium 4572_117]
MHNIDSINHVKGESVYIDDIPQQEGTLYGLVFDSTIAHGKIKKLDFREALMLPGVIKIFSAKDIPGNNQLGAIIQDEPLFAEKEVHFVGQAIALIVAENELIARKAKQLISIEFEELPVITDERKAYEKKQFIFPPRTFKLGNTGKAFANCDYLIEGTVKSGAQEHLYIETQGAYVVPVENGCLKVYSSTQGPTSVQKIVAGVLGVAMHKIEVDVRRLGGGFGGKEDQATPLAAMAALAAYLLNKPVKLIYHRFDDIRMTGKRHPYSSDYKIGLDKDLKIIAFEVDYLQNAGAAADLSPAIMERTLFHSTNCYFIPNVRAKAYSCKTNLPPNTAYRGFGAPQAMFVIESAIAKAAETIGVDTQKIQETNLLNENDEFPYGQIAKDVKSMPSWLQLNDKEGFTEIKEEISLFNKQHGHLKQGMALMPIAFGISFTNTSMNQARALVHIYQDGSIGISTGAIEMGQGVNTKLTQVAAKVFSVNEKRIKLETTNTSRVANTSPTAASSGADLNGKALEIACNALLGRLIISASEILGVEKSEISILNEKVLVINKTVGLEWEELVLKTYLKRINLSEKGHYYTPVIHFDKTKEKGHPFAYHVYGTALVKATVDCIRGTYALEKVNIVHDFGKSINKDIDKGQIEGALLQGIGWVTMEEILYDEKGILMSNALSSYKVPDIFSVPKEVNIELLETEGTDMAIMKSKAIGEPPFMYGIAAYFAIQDAIKAYNPNYKLKFDAPITYEKVLLGLYEGE